MEDFEVLLGLNCFEQKGAGIFPSEKILRFSGHTVGLLKGDLKYETLDETIDVLLTEVVYEVDKESLIPLDSAQLKEFKS